MDDASLARPDEEEAQKTAERTASKVAAIVAHKTASAQPKSSVELAEEVQYVRYTPADTAPLDAEDPALQQRMIRVTEMPQDPLEPPRFRTNRKIPGAPPSPPAPVMHSPPRKITADERREWAVPPSISNWKNPRGYTIPLDKRLAADGRGLVDHTINDKFAKFTEALYIGERKAREAVQTRAEIDRKIAQQQKQAKEESLRQLAQKAREERAGHAEVAGQDADNDGADTGLSASELQERERIREELRRERERELRMQRMAPERRMRLERDRDRDVSEQIALGLPVTTGKSNEVQFDQRLFNRQQGVSSGFSNDEAYAVYDKPMTLGGSVATSIYRPSRSVDSEIYGDDVEALIQRTDRFTADKGFQGAQRTDAGTQPRDGPVQFARARPEAPQQANEEDVFGLGKFMTAAKRSQRATDAVGRGELHAGTAYAAMHGAAAIASGTGAVG